MNKKGSISRVQWYNVTVKSNDNPMKLNKAQENYLIEASELVDGDLVFPAQDSLTLLMNLNNLAEVEEAVEAEEVEEVSPEKEVEETV